MTKVAFIDAAAEDELVGKLMAGGWRLVTAVSTMELEKLAEYHGIADVGDEELIKTQHPGLIGDAICHHQQGIGGTGQIFELVVDPLHEPMEVDTPLVLKGKTTMKGIHQVSLAASHPSP